MTNTLVIERLKLPLQREKQSIYRLNHFHYQMLLWILPFIISLLVRFLADVLSLDMYNHENLNHAVL